MGGQGDFWIGFGCGVKGWKGGCLGEIGDGNWRGFLECFGV